MASAGHAPLPTPLPSAATIALIMRAATFCGTGFCQIVALPLATFADTQLVEDRERKGGRQEEQATTTAIHLHRQRERDRERVGG